MRRGAAPTLVKPPGLRLTGRREEQVQAVARALDLGLYRQGPRRLGRYVKGERHPGSLLTTEEVREIRASEKPGVELARWYGVSRSLISQVRSGKRWAWLDEEERCSGSAAAGAARPTP